MEHTNNRDNVLNSRYEAADGSYYYDTPSDALSDVDDLSEYYDATDELYDDDTSNVTADQQPTVTQNHGDKAAKPLFVYDSSPQVLEDFLKDKLEKRLKAQFSGYVAASKKGAGTTSERRAASFFDAMVLPAIGKFAAVIIRRYKSDQRRIMSDFTSDAVAVNLAEIIAQKYASIIHKQAASVPHYDKRAALSYVVDQSCKYVKEGLKDMVREYWDMKDPERQSELLVLSKEYRNDPRTRADYIAAPICNAIEPAKIQNKATKQGYTVKTRIYSVFNRSRKHAESTAQSMMQTTAETATKALQLSDDQQRKIVLAIKERMPFDESAIPKEALINGTAKILHEMVGEQVEGVRECATNLVNALRP